MLEDYIKKIVKEEIAKDNLNKQYGKNGTSVYELYMKEQNLNKENERLKKENQELKESLEKQKQRQYETNEFWLLQKHEEELEKLKKENELLKESIEKIDGKLILKSNLLSEQKEENKNLQGIITNKERIAKELNSMLNKEKRKNKELKQENEKLEIKSSEYYNKFLSEGIKKENAQQLIRKIEKEIDLQGFDQDDFFSPEQTFYRIKNILKES